MVQIVNNAELELPQLPKEPAHGGCGSCGTGKAACGNGLEKIYPSTAVRFGYMRYIGEFTHPQEMKFTCGAKVIIQTKRGIELGEQVSLTCTGCDKSVTRDQMRDWVKTCGEDSFIFDAGRILREATAADLAEYARIQGSTLGKRKLAQQLSHKHNLPMRVVECECPFGGERIVFYFMAVERVDFREMVKDLATEYRTRIEMRQIGARDEARLLADFETCGREVCCKVFLKTLKPVTMRMAKLQKATLDPTQVSGRCGRLKCCLRYEHIGYEELDKRLPRVGTHVRTNHGDGVVANRQILTQLVQIRTNEDKLVTVVAEDIIGPGEPTFSKTPEEASSRSAAAPMRPDERARPPGEGDKPHATQSRRSRPRAAELPTEQPPTTEGAAEKNSEAPASRRRSRGRRRRRGRRDGKSGPETDGGASTGG